MKVAKKTAEYTIFERNDKRYAVRGESRKWINGEEKVKILEAEGLRKKAEPKPQPVEEVAEEAGEATAEATEETAKKEEKAAE